MNRAGLSIRKTSQALFKASKEKADLDMKRALGGDDGSDDNDDGDEDQTNGKSKSENGQSSSSLAQASIKNSLKRRQSNGSEDGGSPSKKVCQAIECFIHWIRSLSSPLPGKSGQANALIGCD